MSPPPVVPEYCHVWVPYSEHPECSKKKEELYDWLDAQVIDLLGLVGEYVATSPFPGAPKKITGYTRHGVEQAILRDGHGVSTGAIRDAVKHGRFVSSIRDGKRAWMFVGKDAVVILNDAGQVVTTWATKRSAWRY